MEGSKMTGKRGIYRKFEVRRLDYKDDPGEKHYGCRYFVLDLDHDPHAKSALISYAISCEEERPELSEDLFAYVNGTEADRTRIWDGIEPPDPED